MRLRIEMDPDGEFERAMDAAPERMRRAIIRGLFRGSEIVAAAAVKNLTKNRQIVSGALRIAMAGGFAVDEKTLTARVGPQHNRRLGQKVDYGLFVEKGRGPGGQPPRGALREFLRRKLGVAEDDLDKAERNLRRSIGRRGTKARAKPFLQPAIDDNRDQIAAAFNRELQKEIDDIEAGRGT